MSPESPTSYDFLAPPRICFGWGRRSEAGELARTLGDRAFVVSGSRTLERNGAVDEVVRLLGSAGVDCVRLATISREPEVADVDEAAARLLEHGSRATDFVLTIGGGAAIDLGKAVAARATNRAGESIVDYLEGVGRGLTLELPPLPVMAIPTTAGTGSEATKNAVISSYDPPFKKSLRSNALVPRVVLVDPELTVSAPAAATAASGMDAITQLIESFISRRAKPVPRGLCRQGLESAVPSIVAAVANGGDREPRERMAHAALLSGMALANSGLGMAHGVAAALGVHCRVTHGLACAVMLPAAMRSNRDVAADELFELAPIINGRRIESKSAAIDAAIERIEEINQRVGIPRRLSEIGVGPEHIPAIVAGSRGNSMSGNPRELSDFELTQILEEML